MLELLANEDPERFAGLYGALPDETRGVLALFSPLGACADVRAPVEVVVPPADVYFPPGEAQALARALPQAHLTVTGTLDHTRPQLSTGRIRDAVRFVRFVHRGLRAAG